MVFKRGNITKLEHSIESLSRLADISKKMSSKTMKNPKINFIVLQDFRLCIM